MDSDGAQLRTEKVGQIQRFFARPLVAVIALSQTLRVRELICIKGHTTDLQQVIVSLQMNGQPIFAAQSGDVVGLHVQSRCREHDIVYKFVKERQVCVDEH